MSKRIALFIELGKKRGKNEREAATLQNPNNLNDSVTPSERKNLQTSEN